MVAVEGRCRPASGMQWADIDSWVSLTGNSATCTASSVTWAAIVDGNRDRPGEWDYPHGQLRPVLFMIMRQLLPNPPDWSLWSDKSNTEVSREGQKTSKRRASIDRKSV